MKQPTDTQVDTVLGIILRTGVIAAAALVLAGGLSYLSAHAGGVVSYQAFHGAPADLRSIRGIALGAASLDPLFIIQFGLIVLMATPVTRVIACVIGFGLERDRKYVWISIVVLALLLVSLVGHGG